MKIITGKTLKLTVLIIAMILLIPPVMIGSFYEIWVHNIHTVIPNRIYRSAQPSTMLMHIIQQKHIQSIINLRGQHDQYAWYRKEINWSEKLGIIHRDITLTSTHMPHKHQLQLLVRQLIQLPNPILLHCLSGSDRSGLASAIALILQQSSLTKAKQQFSILYFIFSKNSIGKLVFKRYLTYLSTHHLRHSKKHFLEWVFSRKKAWD